MPPACPRGAWFAALLACLCLSEPSALAACSDTRTTLHCRGYVLFLTYQTTRAGGGLQDVWQVWVLLLPRLHTRIWCLLRRLPLLLQGSRP